VPATLRRRLAAIARAHREARHAFDSRDPAIRAALRGIARAHTAVARQAAPATPDIRALLRSCGPDLAGLRDRALLLLGYAGALCALVKLSHAVAETGRCDGAAAVINGRHRSEAVACTARRNLLPPRCWGGDVWSDAALRCGLKWRQVAGFLRGQDDGERGHVNTGLGWIAPVWPGGPPVPVRAELPASPEEAALADLPGPQGVGRSRTEDGTATAVLRAQVPGRGVAVVGKWPAEVTIRGRTQAGHLSTTWAARAGWPPSISG
jgi:hypothetical protein